MLPIGLYPIKPGWIVPTKVLPIIKAKYKMIGIDINNYFDQHISGVIIHKVNRYRGSYDYYYDFPMNKELKAAKNGVCTICRYIEIPNNLYEEFYKYVLSTGIDLNNRDTEKTKTYTRIIVTDDEFEYEISLQKDIVRTIENFAVKGLAGVHYHISQFFDELFTPYGDHRLNEHVLMWRRRMQLLYGESTLSRIEQKYREYDDRYHDLIDIVCSDNDDEQKIKELICYVEGITDAYGNVEL